MTAVGVDSPRLDAELLLAEALGVPRESLYAEPEQEVSGSPSRKFAAMVRRRVAREPIAYILGRAHFRNLALKVDSRVLIPRPETELLIESIAGRQKILDVGTGSGAVALAIAEEGRAKSVVATDSSQAALEVARANAASLGLQVDFVNADLVSGGGYDAILSNPPYIADSEWSGLQPEITKYEPREALLAGVDGLDVIRRLIPAAKSALNDGGLLAVEIGAGQAEAATDLMRETGFASCGTKRDLAGIERVVWARR